MTMNFYITYGTIDYLSELKASHENEKLLLLKKDESAALFHESEGESIFKEPKKYEVLDSVGAFENGQYAVLNNIPVTQEGKPLFEQRFKERARMIENEPGFTAIRVLRPVSGDTYVILTLWDSEKSFQDWQNSKAFDHAHKKRGTSEGVDQKSIFRGPSYVTTYQALRP